MSQAANTMLFNILIHTMTIVPEQWCQKYRIVTGQFSKSWSSYKRAENLRSYLN